VHGTPREPKDKGYQDRYGNWNSEVLASNPDMNIERGKAVVSHLIGKKDGSEPKAMYRKDVGWVGIDYGTPGNPNNEFKGGHGLSHIMAKHSGAEKTIVETLQKGEAYKHPESQNKVIIIHGTSAAVLSKFRDGRLLITDYEEISPRQRDMYTSRGKYHVRGENE
jgi:hypothetical protein